MGIIPVTFLTRLGTRRSLHPTHSVCAAGPLAVEIIELHAADTTPCGPNSPFRAIAEHGVRILLGCGLEANTTVRAVEEAVSPPFLFDPPVEDRLLLADGMELRKTYTSHKLRGRRQRYDRVAEILRLSCGKRRCGRIRNISWRGIPIHIRKNIGKELQEVLSI